MKTVFNILIFCLVSVGCFTQNNEKLLVLEDEVMYSKILKQEVKYTICLPDSYYDNTSRFPVVYMLHGLGDNSYSWLEYGQIDLYAQKAVTEGRIIPMIYVMPDGYKTYYTNDFYKKSLYQDMFIKELIPHIDNKYKTRASKQYRATIGYSMGGFGALMLAAKNQDVFSTTVPLSISMRTDEQYMTEESPWWDEQWGRLFGGEGEEGKARLTNYYKENSPMHFFVNNKCDLKIFIDNGDDEQTLASSNEELHMLLRDKKIVHEFRVRNGGHEFSYWREAMYNGLNFISDSFENKPYRGDNKQGFENLKATIKPYAVESNSYQVYLPKDYQKSSRLYPVLYVDADLSLNEKEKFAGIVEQSIEKMEIPQMIVVFLNKQNNNKDVSELIGKIEENLRIRKNRRFRAYLGYKDGGKTAFKNLTQKDDFTCIVSFDTSLQDNDEILTDLRDTDKKKFERTWIYVDAPDKGQFYRGNGNLHILLKEKDIYHEYRVREGDRGTDYLFQGLNESLKYIGKKFHK
ncbi:MAG TPA: alpha/beta hydrolase-fold protein [Dysgonomonas sp.]|uniref:Putative Esterase n=1 Tax=uncultured Dysgonomonas sp. TaxID=206096 RepID=A0A212J7F0_9BACT|nr:MULTISPECIES: alpha/beta hydrolase-fold protein [unclassified Dysgonomonas]SBV95359.1 putative Esterase [uncultured Dysgonomonas sp.]HML66010.1 alpha/beta hydrolase-fold protein [Dysgonomonas sp.]